MKKIESEKYNTKYMVYKKLKQSLWTNDTRLAATYRSARWNEDSELFVWNGRLA